MSKLICLDAGHGLYTSGKRCMKSIDPNETREWALNSRIAGYVAAGLAGYDCRVMRVDDVSGATDVPLSTRVSRANAAKADLFVSIHHNAGIGGGSGGGILVYTCNSPSATSTKLAKAVYDATVARTGLKGNRATPLPTSNFYVIYNTTMPAILGEFGFMDSTIDVPIILTDDFAQKCAKGIVEGIAAVAALTPISGADSDEGNAAAPDNSPSSWAESSCNKAFIKDIFQGDGAGNYDWQGALTREAMAVLLDRCGLLD